MNLLLILWSLGRAGAERVVFELARGLDKKKFHCTVIAAGGGGDMKKEFEKAGIALRIGPSASLLHRWKTVKFLRDQIRKLKPDLIHSHLCDAWVDLALRDCHSCASRNPSKRLDSSVRWNDREIQWLITAHNTDQNSFVSRFVRGRAFRRAAHVACVSETVQSYVQKEFSVSQNRTSVIRNGIDFSKIIAHSSEKNRAPKIITVGRLTEQKDQETLLRALALLRDESWTLDVIGDGPKRKELERLVLQLGILSRVSFVGIVDDVAVRLAHADLFCFPSKWEGQGIAMIEAAAVGVPIIASDLTVFHETFDSQSVKFADVGDAIDWSNAIRSYLHNPSLAEERAKYAQIIARKEFGLEKMVKEYEELYKDLHSSA